MEYKLIRSNRKTIELSIDDELRPLIKAPLNMSTANIDAFYKKHSNWIEKHIRIKNEHLKKSDVTEEEKTVLKNRAKVYLTERTEYFSKVMGLKPTAVKITSAEKRFGSCSGTNSICYSWHLIQYPPEAIDYVVVHELAHIVYKNHGKNFYKLVKSVLPDYKIREKLLK